MVLEVLPKMAKELLQSGKAIALDVREKEEIEFSSIGKHIWIPYNELAKRYTELPKDRQIICVCRTGSRSGAAAEFLSNKGFNAANLRGGIFSWSNEVDSNVRKYVYAWVGEKLIVKEI